MRKTLVLLLILFNSMFLGAQSLGGYHIYDWLVTAVHPNGCDPSYVTGPPDNKTWVNLNVGDIMTGTFGHHWADRPGSDLLLETSYNTSAYIVKLLLTTGVYSAPHSVLVGDWHQISDTVWHHIFRDCTIGSGGTYRIILPLDFQADFGLSPTDSVKGIQITFESCNGAPDLAGVYIIQPPNPCQAVHFGPDTSLCQGESLLLDATSPNSTYQWQDNSTGPTFNVINPGTYWVVVSEPYCTVSDTINVSYIPAPLITNTLLSESICNQESTNIALTSNPPGSTFHWTAFLVSGNVTGFSADSGTLINQTLINTGLIPGIVNYVVTPKTGRCVGSDVNFNITVNPVDTVNVTITASGNNICAGTTVTYTAHPVNGGTSPIYQWYVNGSPQGTNLATYSYNPLNGDIVTCTLTSTSTCTFNNPATSIPFITSVNPVLPVSLTITSSQNPVCAGTIVTYTAHPLNEGTLPDYQWLINGIPQGSNLPSYSYVPLNGDIVTCILTSSETCGTNNPATSLPLNASVNPVLPVSITVSSSQNDVCAGTTVTYTAHPLNEGTLPDYQWMVNGIPHGPNLPMYSYFPLSGDIVTCTVMSSETCTTNNPATSNPCLVTVNTNLPVTINIVASPNPFCSGSVVNFMATPNNIGTNPLYQWKVNGIIAGTNSQTFSYNPSANDSVSCLLTSDLNCATGNPATSNQIILNALLSPIVTFTACFDTTTTVNAKPFKLKGGIPSGGTYTGSGVNSGTGIFNPAIGNGTKIITYSYTNYYLCTMSKSVSIHILPSSVFNCGNPLTDIRDNKVYHTIQIGGQCWMAEDLDFGSAIPSTQEQRDNCIPEKYINPFTNLNPPSSVYQWDELMQYEDTPSNQGLCPPAWHIPTENDWNILFSTYVNNAFAGSALKYSGFSGFDALLKGVRHLKNSWDFGGFVTFFWSSTYFDSTRAWAHGMNDADPSVSLYAGLKANAFSVRCLKD
jgi:uncharacterized protein (TIGR02145 family)